MEIEKLREEARTRLNSCETPEDFLKTASEYGIQFSDEEMAMITGGAEAFRDTDGARLRHMFADDARLRHMFADDAQLRHMFADDAQLRHMFADEN